MKVKTKQIISTILGIASIAGAIGTFISTAIVAPKAKKKVEDFKTKNPKASKIEIAKETAKAYSLPLAITTISAISSAGSTLMSRKAEASLGARLGSSVLLANNYAKAVEKLPKDQRTKIHKDMAEEDFARSTPEENDGKKLFWYPTTGFFYSTPEKLLKAKDEMNRFFAYRQYELSGWESGYDEERNFFSLAEFMDACDAEFLNPNITLEYLQRYGWSYFYILDSEGMTYIDRYWTPVKDKDGKERYSTLSFVIPEIDDYESKGVPIIDDTKQNMDYMLRNNESGIDKIDPEIDKGN